MEPDVKTPEQIAREIAETATLSATENRETGAYEPVIEDLGQFASFIEDGIRADRAQRIPATSASDRYEAARAALAEYDEHTEPRSISDQRRREYRLASALRALIDPATTAPRSSADLDEIYVAAGRAIPRTNSWTPRMSHLAGLEAVHQSGIQASWEDWEPENAPGMVDTRHTEVVDFVFDGEPGPIAPTFIETEFPDGASTSVGRWEKRPDGRWVIRVEVVR